jgi:signal transduction histidine kinase
MVTFDLPTAYFIAGILYIAMPVAVWFLLRKDNTGAAALWCLGSLVFGVSLALLGMRNHAPDWVTFALANAMLFSGMVLHGMGLRKLLGRPVKAHWALLAVAEFVAVYELFHSVLEAPSLRFVWAAVATAGAMFWVGALARKLHTQERISSAQWVSVVYVCLGGALALRAIVVTLGLDNPSATHDGILSILLILFGVLTAIGGNIGVLGIFVERMNQSALTQAALQARQEEATRLGDQIAQLDRRRSVGEIAASLAHELSQPITNIYLITDRMGMALASQKDSTLAPYLNDLNRNTQKASDILSRIRGFIRAKETRFERVELGQVITDTTDLIRDLAHNESVQVDITQAPVGVYVHGDAVQLSQILMNVCRNAIQATQGQAERRVHIHLWQSENTAHIDISDNGPGLTSAILASVSTPFFSTKPDGLGVGLAISKSIAKHHGGQLKIGNHPQGGARVELQLPAVV